MNHSSSARTDLRLTTIRVSSCNTKSVCKTTGGSDSDSSDDESCNTTRTQLMAIKDLLEGVQASIVETERLAVKLQECLKSQADADVEDLYTEVGEVIDGISASIQPLV